jgi:23S rRNA pseudouridine2605 synthase
MRDKPDKNFRLEWPGGIVPEWARPKQNLNKRRGGKAAKGAAGKRERLQKVMAQSGYGSRRNIEILIAQGHITINGQVAKLGDSVGPGDKVKLDGKLISLRYGEPLPRVLLYHKPTGEIVTRDDPEERPTVFEKLPKVTGGRWVSVGRLDFNTEGLLIFTTNGDLANRLTHPRFEVEREYAVRLMGELTEEQKEKLLAGVDIEGELCRFDSIEDRGGEGSNHWYHVVLREGKNREVRRMMEAIGLMVSRLMRVRFGNVQMPGFLKRGQMRELDETQIHELLAFAGTDEPQEDAGEDDAYVEDEHDNIGNRIADMPRERAAAPEADDDYGNRIAHQAREAHRTQHEPDGNRITHHAATSAERPPKQGQARRPSGGKPFGFGKKRGAQGQPGQGQPGQGHPQAQGQGHAEGQGQGQGKHKQHRKQGQPRTPGGQGAGAAAAAGAGARAHGHGPQPGTPPGGAVQKPGRNRRNKNRNRARGAQQGHGEQQPATNGNPEPV